MSALGISKPVLIAANGALFVVGCVVAGLIVVGYRELTSASDLQSMHGTPMVLLALGFYFLVPYTMLLFFSLVSLCRSKVNIRRKQSQKLWRRGLQVLLACFYLAQQVLTDLFIHDIYGSTLILSALVLADCFAPILYCIKRFREKALSLYIYTVVFCAKLCLLWEGMHRFSGSGGVNKLQIAFFFSIPIVQLPVYIDMIECGYDIVQTFTRHTNTMLANLLHALDVFAMFDQSFQRYKMTPSLFYLLGIMSALAFLAGNITFALLFSRTPNRVSLSRNENNQSCKGALEYRVLSYLLALTLFVDLPFFIARVVMWYLNGVRLSIFIVKDAKNILEVAVMVLSNQQFQLHIERHFLWWT